MKYSVSPRLVEPFGARQGDAVRAIARHGQGAFERPAGATGGERDGRPVSQHHRPDARG